MLEQFDPATVEYYDAIKGMSPDTLKTEWHEITLDQYWYLMECVPPRKMKAHAFMVGECMTHTIHGPVYKAVTCVTTEESARYFARPAHLQTFDPEAYTAEIRNQFQF